MNVFDTINKPASPLHNNHYISAIVAFLPVIYLTDQNILTLVIVLGQAHFLITYLYQGLTKKMTPWYWLRFLGFMSALGLLMYFYYGNIFFGHLLILITLSIFMYHYSKDEFKILDWENSGGSFVDKVRLWAVLSVFLSYLPLLLKVFFNIPTVFLLPIWLLVMFSIFLFVKNLTLLKEKVIIDSSPFIFYVLNVFLPLFFFFVDISIYQIAGFIILFHYTRWYLHYFKKFTNYEKAYYTRAVIICNSLSVTGFFLYSQFSNFEFLFVIYSPLFFYCWTLMHILLTIRKDDFEVIKS